MYQKGIMKSLISILFAIYITSVTGVEEISVDRRYPLDARIIQGALNGRNLVLTLFEVNENKTIIDYYIMDDYRSCGAYKLEMNEDFEFGNDFRIVPLSQDNILLLPFGTKSFTDYLARIEIVNLSSCQKTEVAMPTKEITEFQITKYIDSFDMYFKDSSLCKKSICRNSYDFQGNLISKPFVEFDVNTNVLLVQPVGAQLRSQDHLAVTSTEEKKVVYLVKANKLNILTEIGPESEFPTTNEDLSPEISTSHNFISIVYRMNFTSLIAMKFDLEGNLKFKTAIKYNYFIRTAKILNSPNGEVYIIASECKRDHCSDDENSYLIKKIDEYGNVVGSFSLTFPLPGILEDLSFDEENESYCLTRAQISLGSVLLYYFKRVDIHTKCFTDEDFPESFMFL